MNASRRGKKLSRARRWSRVLVWSTFVVVLAVRFFFPPEPVEPVREEQQGGDRGRRYRRPPTRVEPPVSNVPGDLWRIHITLAPEAVQTLRGYFWSGWEGGRQVRPEVLATVREGAILFTNVALHLKGAAGSFRAFDDKPALTLNFSKHVPEQRFHGYDKISLNNSVQDPSYLSEAISRELFEAAGVPVPRADHATVLINGRDLGLFVLTEGFGKPFLKRYFKNVSGNLYDGGFVQEVNVNLDTNSGDKREDRSDLTRLLEAAGEPHPTNRWQRLNQVLDMDRFLSFVAMEIMTCHWDGYALNRNNYRLFHNVETGRMVFMPHGLDQMFGVVRSAPNSAIQPMMQGFVARAVSTVPEGRRLLLQRIAALRTDVFLEEKMTNRVHELSRRIRPTLAAYSPGLANEHDAHVAYLCERIVERARSISEQLASPQEPIGFDARGVARLVGWTPRPASQQTGLVRLEKTELEGKTLLQIHASQGGGTASWRSRVLLETGRYRFEGKVRTSGVGATGGVSLRISGTRDNWPRASDNDWTQLHFNLTVDEPLTEVELICELRAREGQAWFDEESLRLVRE